MTLDSNELQSAWRSQMAQSTYTGCGDQKSRSMVIHKIAPDALDPDVSVVEIWAVNQEG